MRLVISTLSPLMVLWPALIALAYWRHGRWPVGVEQDVSFVAMAVLASFLVLVATMMLRRMYRFDPLTVSLAAAFGVTSIMPFYIMASRLWPLFFAQHRFGLILGVSTLMIGVLSIAIVMLAITPDGSYAEQRHDEGVIEGHAEGVAQEKRDQYDREQEAR